MALGSHASLDGYRDVKACAVCGKRLVVSGALALQFETNVVTGAVSGWHSACKRPAKVRGESVDLDH